MSVVGSEVVTGITQKNDNITRKKPQNPWKRMYEPEKSAAILASIEKDQIILEQYHASGVNPLYRPVLFSSPKPKLITPKKGNHNSGHHSGHHSDHHSNSKTHRNPLITPNGKHKALPFQMITPEGGTILTTKRYQEIELDGVKKTLFFASPARKETAGESVHKRRCSETEETDINILTNITSKTNSRNNARDTAIAKHSQDAIKGGETITLNLHKRRRKDFPAAKIVMGFTAKEALKAEIRNKKRVWDNNKIALMESMLEFSLEHLHRLAFSLSPKEYNPQKHENLGVAGSWINTNMMVLEIVARFFASQLKDANTLVAITPTFKMQPESPLIDQISYEVILKANGKTLTFKHIIEAFALPDRSNWPSSTDAEHLKIVAEALLYDTPPNLKSSFALK